MNTEYDDSLKAEGRKLLHALLNKISEPDVNIAALELLYISEPPVATPWEIVAILSDFITGKSDSAKSVELLKTLFKSSGVLTQWGTAAFAALRQDVSDLKTPESQELRQTKKKLIRDGIFNEHRAKNIGKPN